MNINVLATGMKSLLALGIGFIYVRQSVAEPCGAAIHGNATADYLHWLAYDDAAARSRTVGQRDTERARRPALGSSLERSTTGPENIDAHTTGLSRYTIDSSPDGYQVITPVDALGPIVTFHSPFDNATIDRLIQHLAADHIVVVKQPRCRRRALHPGIVPRL
jgi:hypothetical protein